MKPAYSDLVGVMQPAQRRRGTIVLANPGYGRRPACCRSSGAGMLRSSAACCGTHLGDSPDGPVGVVTTFLPDFAAKLNQLAQLAAGQGIQLGFNSFGGYRDQAMTALISQYRDNDYAAYVKQLALSSPGTAPKPIDQWRPLRPFGQIFHNFGAAADLNPVVWPSTMGTRSDALSVLQGLAPVVGLTFPLPDTDPSHVQLQGSLQSAQNLWLLQQANLASQPDVLSVSLPSEVAAGNIPPVSTTPGMDLQQLLTPKQITVPPPNLGGGGLTTPELVAIAGVVVGVGAILWSMLGEAS